METQSGGEGLAARPPGDDSFIQGVAGRLADNANVRTVYGQPVDRDGATVIPVAAVRYGFGGGTGRKHQQGQEGTGAGGGIHVSPVGYIEMHDGKVKFRRIRVAPALLRVFGIGLAALALARAIAELVRARREPGGLGGVAWGDRRRVMKLRAAIRALPAGDRRQLARRLKALRRVQDKA